MSKLLMHVPYATPEYMRSQIVEEKPYARSSKLWDRFLMFSLYVREVQVSAAFCDEEFEPIQNLVAYNGGSTFLPCLRSIIWKENPIGGGLADLSPEVRQHVVSRATSPSRP